MTSRLLFDSNLFPNTVCSEAVAGAGGAAEGAVNGFTERFQKQAEKQAEKQADLMMLPPSLRVSKAAGLEGSAPPYHTLYPE